MINRLFLSLILVFPTLSFGNDPASTLLISLFFGATPLDTHTVHQAGNHYSLTGKRFDDRLIQIKTLDNHSAHVELTTHEFTAALYDTLAYRPFEPGFAVTEIENISGFQVHPVITEHGIQIDIDAQTHRSSIEESTQRIQTRVLIKEGKWALLTGEIESAQTTNHIYRTNPSREDAVWIKAQLQ